MQEGRHVSQGDLIGFVGSTGWATGPHLHYEFRVNGNHVDPLSIALPNLPAATVDSYANFRSRTKVAVEQLAMIRGTSLEGQAD
jgi:murein DD-endopeptidase MepM/ murein hydrolase activator NlpD